MTEPGISSQLSVLEYRRLALMSLWVGLIATVGILFAFVPNLELVLLVAFLGGVALGPVNGFYVAVLGEAVFSAFNPIGSGLGFPILYLFQIVSVGMSGLMGGLLASYLRSNDSPLMTSLSMGVSGLLITLFYDLLTALSFPLSTGLTEGTIWATLAAGLIFFIMHLVSNTILFTLFGPGLVHLIHRQLLIHGLDRG